MSETIQNVHTRLDYETYAPHLKMVKGVYARLMQLQRAATTPQGLREYTSFLELSIAATQTRLNASSVFGSADVARAQEAFTAQVNAHELRIGTRHRTPDMVSEWVAKWVPDAGQAYYRALDAWSVNPSKQSEAMLTSAIDVLYAAYLDGFHTT